jgi:hypothetical protein
MLVETTGHFKTSQVLFIDLGGLTSFCHQLDFSIRLAIRKQSPGAAIILCSDKVFWRDLLQHGRIIAAPGAIGEYDFLRSRAREKDDSYSALYRLPQV